MMAKNLEHVLGERSVLLVRNGQILVNHSHLLHQRVSDFSQVYSSLHYDENHFPLSLRLGDYMFD